MLSVLDVNIIIPLLDSHFARNICAMLPQTSAQIQTFVHLNRKLKKLEMVQRVGFEMIWCRNIQKVNWRSIQCWPSMIYEPTYKVKLNEHN